MERDKRSQQIKKELLYSNQMTVIRHMLICYDKTVFLKEQKASNIFLLFSKLFILITLLISGAFIMVVKNLAEMSSYQRLL